MACQERGPQASSNRVSVSSLPESLKKGNNALEPGVEADGKSSPGRRQLAHAGRVLSRLENGYNTPLVRHEAEVTISRLPVGSQVLERLLRDVTETWRHQGPVEDSELDTYHQSALRD